MTDPILDSVLTDAKQSVRIQDDLFRWVNGTWLDTHEIPADRPSDGSFYLLNEQSEERVKAIIDELSQGSPEGDAKKIADYFRSYMNLDAINEAGIAPLEGDLSLIRSADTKEALAGVTGTLMRTGVRVPFSFDIDADLNDPDTYVLFAAQSGLSLPDEAYYRAEQHAPTFEDFRAFVPEFLELAGLVDDPEGAGARIVGYETALASHHADVVTTRDTDRINNPMPWSDFVESAPGFDWDAAREALGVPADLVDRVIVLTPDALAGAATVWSETDLDTLKEYLSWQVLLARASYLTEEIDNKNFEFFRRRLTGTTEQKERWKRAVAVVSGVLGEALGKIYVERHFPPDHKAKMEQLVADLLEAYRESIQGLDWMGEETKVRAMEKLATFNPKIGYPDRWRDYAALEITDDLLGNVRAANAFETDRAIAKLGKPMDRDEWFMPPQMVNAYYNPVWNEIVFPAAILQPPFFDPDADDAWNYGGIGAVIGHEIGHGFDDQGSKYDATGRLNNWWTDEDRKEFEKRADALIAQYNAYTPAQLEDSEHHVNGALTIGENIGDLGGLTIGLKAYEIALRRAGYAGLEDAPVINGVTGAQRVFYSYARIWRSKSRDEMAIVLLSVDPHSPAEFRCNGVVKNLTSFHEAFDVTEGDELYLPPAERVAIW
ncbi:M13 family peptidase [Flaviflexus salsibiostraticola]|uniref:M13 family peptidase n=1 Tax=Flaviflexus salsibiostraticola TaxID=1282737 RepID=A0A3Q8WT83_9ACTO|nr:M13-type metalloendopeptidase [Flaviflexus salsibiostraticola]AZN29776.1 M13 family peptidase [Flaviflexus salsibiostraticola]